MINEFIMYIRSLIFLMSLVLVAACGRDVHDGDSRPSAGLSMLTLEELLDESGGPDTSDSLEHHVRRAVSDRHYGYVRERRFSEGLAFLDSLERIPYIKEHCQYELLSGKAGLNQLAGNNDEALRYAREYEKLPANPEKDAYIREMEIISGVYMYCGNDLNKAISALEKAVEVYRQGGRFNLMIRIISRLGSYYRMVGEYEKAAMANQEAIGSYNDSLPAQNVVIAYGEQSNLYGELEIYDRALEMNRKAQHYSLRSGSFGLGDLYRYRADLFMKMADSDAACMDSVFHYLHLAGEESARQGSYKGVFVNNVQLAAAYMRRPDSLRKALPLLRSIAPDTLRMPQWVKYEFCRQFGSALCLAGDEPQGISLIRRAAAGFSEMKMQEEEHEVNGQLADYYRERGDMDEYVRYHTRNRLIGDSLKRNEALLKAAAANIRFEIDRIEEENRMLSAQMERQRMRQRHDVIIIAVLVLLVVAVAACLLYFRRKLNARNRELTAKVREKASNDNISALHNLTVHTILKREDEQQFRQSFARIWPDYLPTLRRDFPQITRNEELLAMLIILNHSTDEISLILGINRNSVNVIRSRMRKNIGLAKEQSLDDLLRSYL